MRPVNLIPPEQRHGERTPLRAGVASYALVGGLVAALIAVTAWVLTANSVREGEATQSSLESDLAVATQRAESVRGFAEFASIAENRVATLTDLARSRFDWERVLREMSRVLPRDVWLVKVTGTVSPDVQVPNSLDVNIRNSVAGPALSIDGCVVRQSDVGKLVNSIEDIDGVTRVTVATSRRSLSAGADDGGEDCRMSPFVARFQLVAAFDEVQIDPASGAPVPLPEPASSNDGGVAEAEAEGEAARDSLNRQNEEAQQAADFVTGAVGGGR